MNRRFILLFVIVCLLRPTSLTSAKAGGSPLLELLAYMPYPAELYYADYAAIEQAYPPARMPVDWAEYQTLTPDTAAELFDLSVWQRVFRQINLLGGNIGYGGDMTTVMGVDAFQIQQVLLHQGLPENLYFLRGKFDVDTIDAALTARGFTAQSGDGDLTLWCGIEGCEHGNEPDASRAARGDLFGGDLGRQWARLIAPNILISASEYEYVQGVMDAVSGEYVTLDNYPAPRAAVDSLHDQGVLLRALLVPNVEQFAFYGTLDPRLTLTQRPAAYRALLDAGYETLPAFSYLLFADLVTETEQRAEVVLVYNVESDAQTAAQMLPDRINQQESFSRHRLMTEDLSELRVTEVQTEMTQVNDNYIVRLIFATPKATPEEIVQYHPALTSSDNADVTMPGLIYNFFTGAYISGDMGWLSTMTREDMETYAND